MADDDMQVIPARHGTATFVPSGSVIKIVNTSGTQVIDTWAFALANPPATNPKDDDGGNNNNKDKEAEKKKKQPEVAEKAQSTPSKKTPAKKGKKNDMDLPSQEEAEAATAQGQKLQDPQEQQNGADGTPKKAAGWSSYIPSLRGKPQTDGGDKAENADAQKKANSRTWSTYLGAGQGFTSYIPSRDSISAFASSHYRDPNKSYAEQLTDFSKTPVGAAGISAISGSGYASSLYAGYSAYTGKNADAPPPMEFLSMAHTRAATLHLTPRVNDTLVTNLREPLLTLLEDTSPGIHDTLIAACDPPRYRGLGVEKPEEHGSCAENLVLALKQLNERAGLKGPNGIGADVTVNAVPAPLNLFMNIPWHGDKGDLSFDAPKSKPGDYVRLKAERDCVVVMSACPQDVTDINNKEIQDGHFVVEENADDADVREKLASASKNSSATPQKKRAPPKKLGAAGQGGAGKKRDSIASTATSSQATIASKKPTASASASAGQAAKKPAASSAPTKRTPVGSKKTPVGTKKAAPAAASSGKGEAEKEKAAPAPAAASKPAEKKEEKKEEKKDEEKKDEPAAAAPPKEKKKPRKLAPKGDAAK